MKIGLSGALLCAAWLAACSTAVEPAQNVQETAASVQKTVIPASQLLTGKAVYRADAYAAMPMSMPMENLRLVPDRERYGTINPNPVHAVAQQPVSTFSIDVDTGSYANIRRFLNNGRLPPADAVRLEEMVNYFDYRYALPSGSLPFAVHHEITASPWQPRAKILKIGIAAREMAAEERPAANLVFLIDVSGSMDSPDKLPLVRQTLRLLVQELRAEDRITLISYASGVQLLLPPTSGSRKKEILNIVNQLRAGGATAGEDALRLAYAQAEKSFNKQGINRIMLATDGDFNVGINDTRALTDFVAEKRKAGISLSTLGFGTGNYNEAVMERIADAGDGNYSYIDNEKEARKVLVRQLTSTLATVAQDVKIQVAFNPATVQEYRLIGYENRLLRNEDFNNDRADAGDIGAGHSVTALYEIIPAGEKGWLNTSRYQPQNTAADHGTEFAEISLRYKQPGQKDSRLLQYIVKKEDGTPLDKTSADTRWAVAVAAFGEALRGGKYNGAMDWAEIRRLAQSAAEPDAYGLRKEMLELIDIAESLSSEPAAH